MNHLIVTFSTAVLFLGMILLLAAKPRYAGKITGTFIALVAVGGLVLYGYGFAVTIDNLPLAIVRALMAVCGMFMGRNELSAIADTPLMQNEWMHLVFWLLQLLALYATASAAITTVGAEAPKKLRLWLARHGQLNLIYGIHDDTLSLGKQLVSHKKSVVVFVDAKPDAGQIAAISAAGCALRSDSDALLPSPRFLRSIGLGKKRELVLYALHPDTSFNLAYAQRLLEGLQSRGIAPERTRLVILGKDDQAVRALQVRKDAYGFGYVSSVDVPELVARLLMQQCPPCDTMHFDAQGSACSDFEALVVGFGQTGHAVLKQLVMNGQFAGSTFHGAVFAPDCQKTDGLFAKQFAGLLREYDISFHPYDGRSGQMYQYLDSRAGKLKYIAICTGNEKLNRELAEELASYFRQLGHTPPICQCSRNGIRILGEDGRMEAYSRLYDADLLSREGLDRMAMILNHRYHAPTEQTALETWMDCDYFSRQSCRASADFAPAMLRMADVSAEEAKENWRPEGELLLNLSKTEHLRWNAFHYCMGFNTMTDAEFQSRAAEYQRQVAIDGKATIRIAKNMAGRTHACLVSWEALKDLSEKEAAITGQYTDYQHMDTENVLALPQLLRAAERYQG